MPTVQPNAAHLNIPNTFGHITGLIWRARLGHRFKAALQTLLVMVSERRGQFQGDRAVVTYPARYIADLLQVSPNTAARTIGELHAVGLVTRTVVRRRGYRGAIVTTIIHLDRIAALPKADEGWRRTDHPSKVQHTSPAFLGGKEAKRKKDDPPKPPTAGKPRRQRREDQVSPSYLTAGSRKGYPDTPQVEALEPELERYDREIEMERARRAPPEPDQVAQESSPPVEANKPHEYPPQTAPEKPESPRTAPRARAATTEQVRASARRYAAALVAMARVQRGVSTKSPQPSPRSQVYPTGEEQQGVINGETGSSDKPYSRRPQARRGTTKPRRGNIGSVCDSQSERISGRKDEPRWLWITHRGSGLRAHDPTVFRCWRPVPI